MSTIQALHADYVLSVKYDTDSKSGNRGQFEKLVKTLHDGGFTTQVRSGSDASHLLVFIKLKSYEFAEQAEIDLVKNYEFGVTSTVVQHSARLRIIYAYLTNPTDLGGLGVTVGDGAWSFVTSIMPVTDSFDNTTLFEDVKQEWGRISHQKVFNTDVVVNTFGPQIGLYFEFFKFYIVWLAALSVFSTLTYVLHHHRVLSFSYTIINLVWGLLFISFWNKRQQFLVNSWGVQNCHKVDEHYSELAVINKNFEAKSSYQHAKGKNFELTRFIKQLAFVPVALGFVAILVSYQLTCFVLEIFLTEIYNGPLKIFVSLIPIVMMAVFVPILSIIYNIVAGIAIKWENHDNSYSKNNSIIVKQFVLDFLTSYIPLLITSFIYLPFAHFIQPQIPKIRTLIDANVNQSAFYYKYLIQLTRMEDYKVNQQRLSAQFFFSVVTNQVIQLGLKYVLPLVLNNGPKLVKKFLNKSDSKYEPKDDEKEASWLDNIRSAEKLPTHNVDADFRGLVSQYGFLIMFGAVWPLAPIISLIFNLITFKMDSMKLVNGKYFKPPIPNRVDSIHPWNYALFGLTWFGSVIGPVVTLFYRHGTAPPKTLGQFALDKASVHVSSSVKLLLVLFVCEHGFLVAYYVLSKLLGLSKSEIEWKNDFTDNDIKLRHDYYTGKVKPTIKAADDKSEEIWNSVTVEQTLQQAQELSLKKPSANTAKDEPTTAFTSSSEKGASSVTNRFDKSSKAVSSDEKLQDERRFLESIKDAKDEIIESTQKGEPHLSTIDHNEHFKPPSDEDVKKILKDQKTSTPNSDSSAMASDEKANVDLKEKANVDLKEQASSATEKIANVDIAKVAEEVNSAAGSLKQLTPETDLKAAVDDGAEKIAKKKSSFKKLFKKT